jgi:hypothetical protein
VLKKYGNMANIVYNMEIQHGNTTRLPHWDGSHPVGYWVIVDDFHQVLK